MASNSLVLNLHTTTMLFGRECCRKRESTEQKGVCGSAIRCPIQANKNKAVLLQTCLQCSLDDGTVHFRKEFV